MKIGWKRVIIIFSYEPQSEMKRQEIYEKALQFRALDYRRDSEAFHFERHFALLSY